MITVSLVRTHSGAYFVINFASLSPVSAWPSLAQFSLNNVHTRGLKHHHFISTLLCVALPCVVPLNSLCGCGLAVLIVSGLLDVDYFSGELV